MSVCKRLYLIHKRLSMRLKSKSNNDPKEIKSPIINLINVY